MAVILTYKAVNIYSRWIAEDAKDTFNEIYCRKKVCLWETKISVMKNDTAKCQSNIKLLRTRGVLINNK